MIDACELRTAMCRSIHRSPARPAGAAAAVLGVLVALAPLVVSIPQPTPPQSFDSAATAAAREFARHPSLAIEFGRGTSAAERRTLIARVGGTHVRWISALDTAAVVVPQSRLARAEHVLKASLAVRSVAPDYVRSVAGLVSRAAAPSQWNLRRIGWPAVYAKLHAKRTVRLAVVDTGVDASVPALRRILLPGYSVFRGSLPTVDPNGHGTAMASIAAAALRPGGLAGVAYTGVRIMPVQALNAQGIGRDSGIVRGVLWAANHGANVILLSLDGAGYSSALQRAVSFAWSKGAVVVAATGNGGSPSATFPAGDAKVVGVSATDRNDHLWAGSNFGSDTFLAAPGVEVPAYAPGGSTRLVAGTSASAASVAGAASLLMAAYPRLSNAAVVGRLAATAARVGTRRQTGNGRLDLARAVSARNTTPLVPRGVRGRAAGGVSGGPYRAATALSGVTIGATRSAAGAVATYSVGFTTSGSGALAASDTITVTYPAGYTVPSSPAPAIGGLGSFNCSGAAGVVTRTITITLANSGGTCSIGASATVSAMTIGSITNPTTIGSKSITVKTSKDTTNATGTYSITAATGVSSVSFSAPRLMGGSATTYTASFTTSSTGSLAAGDRLTVVFPAGYTVGATPSIGLGTGFTHCSASSSVVTRTITITLADSGGACAVGNSTAASLTIGSITNPAAAGAKTITIADTNDTTVVSANVTIVAATTLTSVSIGGADSVAGDTTTYTASFTTSSTGSLAAGDTITVTFAAGYVVGASPAITPGTGFTNCSATSPGGSTTVTITLADSGGTCAVGNSTAASLQIGSVTNPTAIGAKTNKILDSADATSVNSAFTITPGAPASLTYNVQPTGVSVDAGIAPAIKVRLLDQYGNLTTSTDHIQLAFTSGHDNGATLIGTTTVAAAAGTATFSGLHIHVAATGYELTASDTDNGGVTTVDSSSFDMTTGALTQLSLQAASTTPTAGTADNLTVTAQDQYGNTEATYTGSHNLTFSGPGSIGGNTPTVTSAGGTATALGSTTAITFTSGVATVSGGTNGVAVFYKAESTHLVVTDGSVSNGAGLALNVNPSAAVKLAFTSGTGNLAAGSVRALTAAVEDTYGNTETGDNSTIVGFAKTAGSGTVDGLGNATAVAGVASLNATGHLAGSITITASNGGLASDASTFTVVPGSVAQLVYAQGPTGALVTNAISPAVSVDLLDAYGNLTTSSDHIQLAFATGHDNGATLLNGGSNAAVAGVATFSSLQIHKAATGYELTATDLDTGAATPATSGSFDMTIGAPDHLVFHQQPTGGSVDNPISPAVTVDVTDVYGNVESSTDHLQLAFATGHGNGATLLGGSSTAAVAGEASFAALHIHLAAASYELTATDLDNGSITAATSSAFTMNPGAATQLAFSQQPTTTSVDNAIAPAVTVAIEDQYGNTTTSVDHLQLAFATGHDNGGSLLGGGSRAAVAGVATFSTLHIHLAATAYELTATDVTTGTVTAATSSSFDMTPGAETKIAYTQQPLASSVDGPVTPAVTVAVEDQYSNVVTGSTDHIQLAFTTGFDNGGTLLGGGSTAAVSGVATFANLHIHLAAANYKLTATDLDNGGIATLNSSAFTMKPGAVTQLTYNVQPTGGSVDAAIAPAIKVRLLDQYGNLTTATDHIALSLAAGHDNGTTLFGTTSVAANAGTATFSAVHIHLAGGGYELTATDSDNGGVTTATSTSFAMTPGAATHLAYNQAPTGGSVDNAIAPAVTVDVEDQYSNVVTTSTDHIQLAFAAGHDNGATLLGGGSTAAVAGEASFAGLHIHLAATNYELKATDLDNALTAVTSAAFTMSPGVATQLAFNQQPTGGSVDNAISPGVTVDLLDQYGNLTTSGDHIQLAFTSGHDNGATLLGGGSTAATAGEASFGGLQIHLAATGYQLTATDTDTGSITSADSSTFTMAPGAVTRLVYNQGPTGGSVDNAIAPAVTVDLLDQYGNLTTSTNHVKLAFASGHDNGATLIGGGSTAAVAGEATFAGLQIHLAATGYELTATDVNNGGASPATSANFDMTVGAPAQLAFNQQPTGGSVDNAISPSVTVDVEDQYGNLTASTDHIQLAFAAGHDNGATLLGGDSTAASTGEASFAALHIHVAATGYRLTATDADNGAIASATSTGFAMTAGAETQLAFAQQPTGGSVDNAVSPAVTVDVLDQYGNVTTSTDQVQLAFAAGHDNGATLIGGDPTPASGGAASFAGVQIHLAATSYELTATDLDNGSVTSADSASFDMSPGAATHLAFTQQPTSGSVDNAIAPAVTVAVEDQFDNVTGSTDHVQLDFAAGHDNGATLLGGGSTAGVAGEATFSNVRIHLAGTGYELTATDTDNGAIASATSASFDMASGAATQLSFNQQPTSGSVDNAISPAVTVDLLDQYGNLTGSNDHVQLAFAAGHDNGATLLGGGSTAASAGEASFAALHIHTAANGYELTATDTDNGSVASVDSASFDMTIGAPAQLAFHQQPTGGSVDNAISPAVTVDVLDQYGNLEPASDHIQLAFTAGHDNGATLIGGSATAASAGEASFAALHIHKAATGYQLTAADLDNGLVTAATSLSFDMSAGAATQLAFTQQPTAGLVDNAISPAVTVAVEDQYGNLTSSTDHVQLAFASGHDNGATLLGGGSTAASVGEASFSSLQIHKAGTGYELTATDLDTGSATPATSASFDMTVGAATKLAFIQQPTTSSVDGPISPAVTVAVEDQYSNVVTSSTDHVQLAFTSGFDNGQTLSGGGPTPASSGIATFAALHIHKAATGYELSATDLDNGLATTSGSFTMTPGAIDATQSTIGASPSSIVANGSDTTTITVQAVDRYGNAIDHGGSTVTLSTDNGTFAGVCTSDCTTTDNGDGTYSATLTSPTSSSGLTATIRGSIDATPISDTATVDLTGTGTSTVGNAVHSTVDFGRGAGTGRAQVGVGGSGVTVTVTVKNESGMPLSGKKVELAQSLAGGGTSHASIGGGAPGSDAANSGTTDGNGQVTFRVSDHTAEVVVLTAKDVTDSVTIAQTVQVTFTAGAATALVFRQQPTGGSVDTAISPAVTMDLIDRYGNVVRSADHIALSLASGHGNGATLSGGGSKAARAGDVSFAGLHIHRAAAGYELTATDLDNGSVTSADSSTFAMTAGVPAQLAFDQQPRGGSVDNAISPAVTVDLLDQYGNLTSLTDHIRLAFTSGHANDATLLGGGSRAARAGEATFAALHIHKGATGYQLTATAPNNDTIAPATSASFAMSAGAPAQLAFKRQPTGGSVDNAIRPAVTADLLDQYGNLTSSTDHVRLVLGPGHDSGATLSGGSTAASSGVATFGALHIDKVGTGYELTATDADNGNVASATSASFDMRAGASTGLAVPLFGGTIVVLALIGYALVYTRRRRRVARAEEQISEL